MTKERAIELIRGRMEKYKHDHENRIGYTGDCDEWFEGVQRGLKDALEIVGMIDNNNR
jgi:hypothetical protein